MENITLRHINYKSYRSTSILSATSNYGLHEDLWCNHRASTFRALWCMVQHTEKVVEYPSSYSSPYYPSLFGLPHGHTAKQRKIFLNSHPCLDIFITPFLAISPSSNNLVRVTECCMNLSMRVSQCMSNSSPLLGPVELFSPSEADTLLHSKHYLFKLITVYPATDCHSALSLNYYFLYLCHKQTTIYTHSDSLSSMI